MNNFKIWLEVFTEYIFWHMNIQIFQHHFFKKSAFPPLNSLWTFVGNQLSIYMWAKSLQVMSDSLRSAWLLCPWNSPSKNIGVGCYALLQGIFLTQGSNLSLLHVLHWLAGSLLLVPPGSPFCSVNFFVYLDPSIMLSSLLYLYNKSWNQVELIL